MKNLERYRFAFEAGLSVAFEKTPRWQRALNVMNSFAVSPKENADYETTQEEMGAVLRQWKDVHGADFSTTDPWLTLPWSNTHIDTVELFGISVSFTDFLRNDRDLPNNLIAPSRLCQAYIEKLIASSEPLLLHQQFANALELVGPYPSAASILLMFASRYLARRMDERMYRDLGIEKKTSLLFPYRIAGFGPSWVQNELPDPPGNTYYYWTNVAMGMVLVAHESTSSVWEKVENRVVDVTFSNGPDIMWLGRKYTAREPNMSTHRGPAVYGFATGKHVARQELSNAL